MSSQTGLGVKSTVDVWHVEHSTHPTRLGGSFCDVILQLLPKLIDHARTTSKSPEISCRYTHELRRLYLWRDGAVPDGRLDEVLEKATELRTSVLSQLLQLSYVLTTDFVKLHGINDRFTAELTKIEIMQEKVNVALPFLDFHGENESVTESQTSEWGDEDMLDDIACYIDCLMDLCGALENPVLDVGNESYETARKAGEAEVFNASSTQALAYCRKARDQYPNMPKFLVERLGEANAARSIRLTDLRTAAAENRQTGTAQQDVRNMKPSTGQSLGDTPSEQIFTESHDISDTAGSTSRSGSRAQYLLFDTIKHSKNHILPKWKAAEDAESDSSFESNSTITSAMATSHGRPRVPDLPEEAKEGGSFACLGCQATLHGITRRSAWKKHIFADLLPYSCTAEACRNPLELYYASSKQWAHHELQHFLHSPVGQESLGAPQDRTCLFCGRQVVIKGYFKHVAKHLREVSLAALPHTFITDDDSSDGSENNSLLSHELRLHPPLDLGSERQAQEKRTTDKSSESLHLSNASSLHSDDETDDDETEAHSAQRRLATAKIESNSLRMTPLLVDDFVVYDNKQVERITDRGEAAYRSRPGHARRSDIKIDKLGTADGIINIVGDQLDKAEVSFDRANDIRFIPRASFDKIITPEVIAQVVNQLACYRQLSTDERIQVAGDIYYGQDSSPTAHGPCRKLLATLIGVQGDAKTLETVEEIKRHMDEGMSDDCLPLLYDDAGLLICRLHGHRHPFINHEGPRRRGWRKSFLRWSRALMVPYIMWGEGPENLHRHYVMHGGGPLPMAPVSKAVGSHVHHGGFGDVLKVRIHDGDRNFQGPWGQSSFFALKKLKENGEDARIEFDLEVRSLIFTENRANSVPGPNDTETKKHVIQLLASFEVQNSNSEHPTYYLLFPWAEGNLEEFWEQQDKQYSPRNQEQTEWMIEQFYHLAKALQCLHNDRKFILSNPTDSKRVGRHGDIKPGNFLYFCNNNGLGFKLVLADFGLGRLHSKDSRSIQPPNVPNTVTYAAPEYELAGGTLSPRSDIFSLGCVMLEHMVWLFHGHSAVEVFTDQRMTVDHHGFESDTFWEVSGPGGTSARIKSQVSEVLTTLKNHDDCVEVIGEILEVIEKDMLQPKPNDRCTSQGLVNEMDKIRVRWERRDSFYGTRAWKDSQLPPETGTWSRDFAPSILQTNAAPVAGPSSILDTTSGANPDSPPTTDEESGKSVMEGDGAKKSRFDGGKLFRRIFRSNRP